VPEQTIGSGQYTWKYAQESADTVTGERHVRLYGRGMAGDAVRTYSVLTQISVSNPNLLSNPGIESGTSDWTGLGDCDLEQSTDRPYAGTYCLHVKNRVDPWSGPRQEISADLESGVFYDLEVWVRTKDFTENVTLCAWVRSMFGWTQVSADTVTVGNEWTRLQGTIQPTWFGDLLQAYFKVETEWSNREFWIDDASLKESSATVSVLPIPGTWRQEISP